MATSREFLLLLGMPARPRRASGARFRITRLTAETLQSDIEPSLRHGYARRCMTLLVAPTPDIYRPSH